MFNVTRNILATAALIALMAGGGFLLLFYRMRFVYRTEVKASTR